MNELEIEFYWDEANLGHVARHTGGRVPLVKTWREDRVCVVTAFEPIKRLVQFYYEEQES
jgi:hypothetical protein